MQIKDQLYLDDRKFVLIQQYSPCTNCANAMLRSNLFVGLIYYEVTNHDPRGLDHLKPVMPCLDMEDLRLAARYSPDRPDSLISDIRERVVPIVRTWSQQTACPNG